MSKRFTTADAVIEDLLYKLSPEDKSVIQTTDESKLFELHFSLGITIRNNYGLWTGNQRLLNDCGVTHPDHASAVLIKKLWLTLH